MAVPRHERRRGIDALRTQDVAAHRRLGEHGQVAARRHRQGDHRHVEVEHAARADVAGEALEAVADRRAAQVRRG